MTFTKEDQEFVHQRNDDVVRLHIIIQIWEQEFAWTEGDKPIKLAARALTVPKGSSLNHQPMFCFHTMMKMWYWSCLVYDYQRVRSLCTLTALTLQVSAAQACLPYAWLPFHNRHRQILIWHLPWPFINRFCLAWSLNA